MNTVLDLITDVRVRQLERGLRVIADRECEKLLPPHSCRDEKEWSPYARESWCSWCSWCASCIARATLDGDLPMPEKQIEGRSITCLEEKRE